MSENIQKLREAIRREWDMATKHGRCICATCDEAAEDAHAALAAVEQEMAKLARSEAYLAERVEALEAQQTQRAQEMAALEAERDELRKRPSRYEIEQALMPFIKSNPFTVREIMRRVGELREAEKAAQ